MELRHAYSKHRRVTAPGPTGECLVKQAFADACNINKIMERYQKTGVVDHFNNHGASYGEVSSQSFTEAMQLVANSQTMFNDLPSRARDHFDNDPVKFLEYFDDIDPENPPNFETLQDLGLLDPDARIPEPDTTGPEKGAPAPSEEVSERATDDQEGA